MKWLNICLITYVFSNCLHYMKTTSQCKTIKLKLTSYFFFEISAVIFKTTMTTYKHFSLFIKEFQVFLRKTDRNFSPACIKYHFTDKTGGHFSRAGIVLFTKGRNSNEASEYVSKSLFRFI